MKSSLVTALVIVSGLAIALSAQERGRGRGRGDGAQKEHTMTGCLAKGTEANSYLVTNVEGNGPKNIGIVESSANLTPHVGHKIAVTGTAVPPAQAEKLKPTPPKAEHYMRITAVKMIAAQCP